MQALRRAVSQAIPAMLTPDDATRTSGGPPFAWHVTSQTPAGDASRRTALQIELWSSQPFTIDHTPANLRRALCYAQAFALLGALSEAPDVGRVKLTIERERDGAREGVTFTW